MTTFDTADLLLPVIPGAPREWDAPEHLIEQAMETLPQSSDTLTPQAWKARIQIASARWFLVVNEPLNEPAKSPETGRTERYFQTLGIDRPWNGLNDIYLWIQSEMDPQGLNPFIERDAMFVMQSMGEAGHIVEISQEKAHELAMEIYLVSRGRYDIMAKARERIDRESQGENRRARVQGQGLSQGRHAGYARR